MIAGEVVRHERTRDLLMHHALLTGQWAKPPSLRDLLGRDPLPVDPRWSTPTEAEREARADAALTRERVIGEAQASIGHGSDGYLTEEELERAYAEARIL